MLNFGGVTDRNVEIVKVIYNDVLLGGRATGLLFNARQRGRNLSLFSG